MEGAEELRETVVAMRREIDILRTETTHANLLLEALDSMLSVDNNGDPFAGAFAALLPVFDYSYAIVLIEQENSQGVLSCVASNHASLVDTSWTVGRTFRKVLSGRTITTISSADSDDWPTEIGLPWSSAQPALYLPLGVRDRRGLLMLLRESDRPGFDRTHVNLARKFSLLASHAFAAVHARQTESERLQLSQITERLQASEAELRLRANHDNLTGLPNRSYIRELVDGIIANKQSQERVALAFVDLDNFKRVNDSYGHAAGDELLKAVARRIRSVIRETDILGRISGDEFVILLHPVEQHSAAKSLVERIRDQLRAPLEIDGHIVETSASIGVAFCPIHGQDYETLRRNADTAMYQAKALSRGDVGFFSRALGKKATERITLEDGLRTAVQRNEFEYALQAKIDLRNHAITGFEALIRWIDDKHVVHAPHKFLPLANELGLLDSITEIALESLISNLPQLDARFGRNIMYSVNVSAKQAERTSFMEKLVRRIDRTGRPRKFMLELTEEAFALAGPFQARTIPLLREVGIGISIDDFGTGYSCLSLLADISADELKVDRSLISSIHQRSRSQSVLIAIASLSAALGMRVVAEGIETQEERSYLLDSTRIAIGQGYLFHKPQLIDELIKNQSLSYKGSGQQLRPNMASLHKVSNNSETPRDIPSGGQLVSSPRHGSPNDFANDDITLFTSEDVTLFTSAR